MYLCFISVCCRVQKIFLLTLAKRTSGTYDNSRYVILQIMPVDTDDSAAADYTRRGPRRIQEATQ